MQRNVIAVVDDLFFASKIRGAVEQADARVIFARTIDAVIAATENQRPFLFIADLHSQGCNPIQLAQKLKSHQELKGVPLVGFFSHLQMDLARRSKEAGFDQAIPRSALTNYLGEILKAPQTGEP